MLFLQLMSRRYGRPSTVLTSIKSFEERGEIFRDELMAAALIRLAAPTTCRITNVRGNSYRMRHHATAVRGLVTRPSCQIFGRHICQTFTRRSEESLRDIEASLTPCPSISTT
jgi:hypothetical protein